MTVLTNTTLSSNTAQGGSGKGGDEDALIGIGLGGAFYIVIGSIVLDMGAVSSNVARGGTSNDYQDHYGAGEGGGLWIGYGTNVELISDTLSSNVAQGSANVGVGEGGGLYIAPGGSSGSYTGTLVSTSSVTFLPMSHRELSPDEGVGEGGGLYIAPPIGKNGTDYVIDVDLDGDTAFSRWAGRA